MGIPTLPKRLVLFLLAPVFVAIGAPASASIVVDGSLADWGVTVGDSSTSSTGSNPHPIGTTYPVTTTVKNGTTVDGTAMYGNYAVGETTTASGFHYWYMIEDSYDKAPVGGWVGPNQGGQDYDGEFIAMGIEGDELKIAILTGQRPDNGFNNYSPGDIRVETSNGVFGIEVGGGIGGGSGGAIEEGAVGTTYKTNNNGYTIAVLNSDGTSSGSSSNVNSLKPTRSEQTAGSVWFNPNWITDLIPNPTDFVQMQFSGGSKVGTADYIYTRNSVGTQHAIIELSVSLGMFFAPGGSSVEISQISWLPSCGNDELLISPCLLYATPEPSSCCLLLMAGLTAFAKWPGRRQRVAA